MRKNSKKAILLLMFCIVPCVLSACGDFDAKKPKDESVDRKAEQEVADLEKKSSGSVIAVPTVVESTPEHPASVKEWVATRRYNLKEQSYYTVYLRITDILREEETVAPYLKAYNNAGHAVRFSPLKDENLAYCVLKYEVMFPAKYPTDERGIPFTDLNFFIRDSEGRDYQSHGETPMNLSTVYDISPSPSPHFSPGDTFSEGTAVFVMEKDVQDYLIENNYYIDKECFSDYYQGK